MNIEDIKVGDYLISIRIDDFFYVGEKCVIKEIYFDVASYETYITVSNLNDAWCVYTSKNLHICFNSISDHRKLIIESLL